MSLKEAVIEVIEQIEQESLTAKNANNVNLATILTMISRQLKIAIKASEGSVQQNFSHRDLIEQAKTRTPKEEIKGERSVQLIGGPYDEIASFTMIDATMPVRAYTVVSGGVYQLKEDGNLHFCEEKTEKLLAKKQ